MKKDKDFAKIFLLLQPGQKTVTVSGKALTILEQKHKSFLLLFIFLSFQVEVVAGKDQSLQAEERTAAFTNETIQYTK